MQNKTKKLLSISLSSLITDCLPLEMLSLVLSLTENVHTAKPLSLNLEKLDDTFSPVVCNPPKGGDVLSH